MRTSTLGILLCGSLMIGGCATHQYTVLEPPKKELTDYRVLEIHEFTSNLGDAESNELADRFAGRLYENVMRDRTAEPEKIVFEQVVRQTNQVDDVLVLDGAVISYDKGSRAARYFVGLGYGKAHCTIQTTFSDKQTGEVILKTNFDGELSMGVFGGSADEAVQGVVTAYLDYFDDYFETHLDD